MAASATLEKNGERKQIPLGFCWTALLFQFCIPIFRKDPNWLKYVIVGIIVMGITGFTFGLSGIAYSIVLGLKYNQMYAKTLLDNGWRPATESDKQALIGNGVNL